LVKEEPEDRRFARLFRHGAIISTYGFWGNDDFTNSGLRSEPHPREIATNRFLGFAYDVAQFPNGNSDCCLLFIGQKSIGMPTNRRRISGRLPMGHKPIDAPTDVMVTIVLADVRDEVLKRDVDPLSHLTR